MTAQLWMLFSGFMLFRCLLISIKQSCLIYLILWCYGEYLYFPARPKICLHNDLNMLHGICSDFLTRSYDIGGVVSVMALSGLFILMTKYGLEYPNFYEKLYALLTPSIFMAKHRAKFFEVRLSTFCKLFLILLSCTNISLLMFVYGFTHAAVGFLFEIPSSSCIFGCCLYKEVEQTLS